MKNKIFLSAICVLICLFAFSVVASAETFYVSTADELKTANASAIANEEADTIYITADIDNAPFVANTSVTYILQANLTNCYTNGGAYNVADYVDIAFYADGTQRTITFKNNVFQTNNIKTKNSTLTFGGLNGGYLIVDMTKYANYFMYDSRSYTVNLREVTFKNLSMNKNDWTLLSANVLNIYDGAKIENCKNANGILVSANTLNMYGGEITGNYTVNNMGRMIMATTRFNMYGGAIYNNYQCNTRSDDYTNFLIDVTGSGKADLYGGAIYGNYFTYTSKTAPNNCGVIGRSGTTAVLGCCAPGIMGVNYGVLTDIKVEAIDGKYQLTGGTVTETESAYKLTELAYSVMFKNTDGGIAEAFIVRADGTVSRSVTGATELVVPYGKWTDRQNWSVEGTVDLTKQGTYFATIDHTPENDDFDCTTTLVCNACKKTIYEAQPSHAIRETLSYGDYCGYGVYTCDCENEGCLVVDEVNMEYAPLITMIGYSVPEYTNNVNVGMVQGFILNTEAIEKYEQINEITLSYGVVVAIETALDGEKPLALVEGKIEAKNEKVLTYNLNGKKYNAFEIKVTGINSDGAHPEQLDAKIIYCAYISNGTDIVYVDNGATHIDPPSRSYNEIK